jgi:Tfp pilus assembly protein PilF
MPERAHDAAKFILDLGDQAPTSASALARAVLGLRTPEASGLVLQSRETQQAAIGRLKAKLREAPRNPALWVDLARAYTLRGQGDPAVRAIRTALALAPGNRFVLRSAARFFLHAKDAEQAHEILRAAETTRHDPWLLAAEIAVASVADRTPRFVKEGVRELAREAEAPLHTSELASALGTLELTAGQTRRARKLFRRALTLPTDNALAQAQWAGLVLTPEDFQTPRSFEARAQDLRVKGEWEHALAEASDWVHDEPFSRKAAAFASYLASVPLERYDDCIELAKFGLVATPREPILLNNLTFALASSGRLEEAERAFALIPSDAFDSNVGPTLFATRGLLFYRRGNLEQGRLNYERAIEEARKRGEKLLLAMAYLYHAREALLAGAPHAAEIWKAAEAEAEKAYAPELSVLRRRHAPGPSGLRSPTTG